MNLTTTGNFDLIGISIPSTATTSCEIQKIKLTVTKTVTTGTAVTIGIRSIGTGVATSGNYTIIDTKVTTSSTGTGINRAILVDTGAATMYCTTSLFSNTSGIAAETNIASSKLSLINCICSGSTADISQTLGTIELSGTILINKTANSRIFKCLFSPNYLYFSDPAAGGTGVRYFYISADASNTGVGISYYTPNAIILYNLSVNSRVGPAVNPQTITVQTATSGTATGTATALAATLTVGTTIITNITTSILVPAGQYIRIQTNITAGGGAAAATDCTVCIEYY
jgi:hypothetical protein